MKKSTLLSTTLGLLSLFCASAQAATITWGGGDGLYLTGSNWGGGSVPNTNGGDTALITAGAVEYVPGGDLAIHNGGSLTLTGGSWTQTGSIAWIQLGGGSLNINGGVFNQGSSQNIVRNASSSITVASGTANFSGNFLYDSVNSGAFSVTGGTVNIQNEFKPLTTYTHSGGALNANLISFADGPGSIDFSGGTISVNGAGGYSGFYGGGAKSLNFTSGSTGTLFFSTYTLAELTADNFLTNGTLKYDGAIAPGSFSAVEGDGGVYVSIVPEPTTPAMMLAGIVGLLAHRRRLAR